jgi:hypothetical protein
MYVCFWFEFLYLRTEGVSRPLTVKPAQPTQVLYMDELTAGWDWDMSGAPASPSTTGSEWPSSFHGPFTQQAFLPWLFSRRGSQAVGATSPTNLLPFSHPASMQA